MSAFALQRCSCGSGERDGECEECGGAAVQRSVAGGAAGESPPRLGGSGHSIAGIGILAPRQPETAPATGSGRAVQRSASTARPSELEEEEPSEAEASGSSEVEGDSGEGVASTEAGEPFGAGGGGEREDDEAVQTYASEAVAPLPRVAAGRVHRALAGGGRPLPRSLRRPMERFYGRDLGAVRIHADDRADRLTRGVGAEAFTVGEHVAFASGRWRPQDSDGRQLLAHELQHVLQQRSGLSGEVVERGIGRRGDPWERQAEAAADDFSRREAREGGAPQAPGDPAAERTSAVAGNGAGSSELAGAARPASAGTVGGPPGGLSLQLYSGSNAATYARRWADGTNRSAYGDQFGNDCTNFVSQSLEAGGWQMVLGCGRCSHRRYNNVWWFLRDGCTRWLQSNIHASHTWGGAENLWQFLKTSGRGSLQGHVMDLDEGDVLQFDNDGNNHIRHTMMVTRKAGGNLFLSYHSPQRLDEPFYPDGENEGILARNPSPPKNYFAWKITGDTGPSHSCPTCTAGEYLGGGLYLREDCSTYLGPGPKF